MSRGIFSLNESYNEQISGDWSTASDVWLLASPVIVREGSPYAYFGGSGTIIQRLDYKNDSLNLAYRGQWNFRQSSGNLAAAIANQSYGYFCGGSPSGSTYVDRIDLSNDSATAVAKGPLTFTLCGGAATGNTDYGWIGGSKEPSDQSHINRIDYTNDTVTASPKGPLATVLYYTGATGNPSYGYWTGGLDGPSYTSNTQRLDFSNDSSAAVVKGFLTVAKGQLASTGNRHFGYAGAGTGPSVYSTADRVDYTNDTATALAKGPLAAAKRYVGATGSHDVGYWCGGYSPGSPGTHVSDVQRLTYASDTTAGVNRAYLNSASSNNQGFSPLANGLPRLAVASNTGVNRVPVGTNHGYWMGANQPANSPSFPSGVTYSTVSRLDFDNDTTIGVTKAPLSSDRLRHTATGNTNFGYTSWGGAWPYRSQVERIDYSNDTASTSIRATLTNTKIRGASVSNSNFGYFMGGSPDYVTTVNRIEYASDTATAVVRGPTANGKDRASITGTTDYGYRAGGYNWPSPDYIRSDVERIDYATDTATAVVKSSLSVKRSELGAAGNANFGYWSGGYNVIPGGNNWVSIVDRMDFSTDTTTGVAKGPLSQTRGMGESGSTGNQNYGYMGGSEGNNDENLSTLDRIDYSNDTATALVRGPLTLSLRSTAACSPRANTLPTEKIYSTTVSSSEEVSGTRNAVPNYGYSMGGWSATSKVDRIDFDNDTATSLNRGNMSVNHAYCYGAGNNDYGYCAGGIAPGYISTVDRVDFANDSATALVKGPLSFADRWGSGTGNKDYGYFGNGIQASVGGSNITRVDYSNDTATSLNRGFRSSGHKYGTAAVSNADFGYWMGGSTPTVSTVDRLDFANDLSNTSPKGPLSSAKAEIAACGNAEYGYITGGPQPGLTTVDRIDYSNDSTDALSRGPITAVKYGFAGTSNTVGGYWLGSGPGSAASTVDRTDFTNDTATAVAKGYMSSNRTLMGAAGPRMNGLPQHRFTISTPFAFGENYTTPYPYGYYGNGNNYNTLVERIDYANDSTSPSRRGYLSAGGGVYVGGVASLNHGYFTGGDVSPNTVISRVERVDFSNDMVLSSIRGPLSTVRVGTMATGTKDYGYVAGGNSTTGTSPVSIIDRINYANDTTTASPRGPLSVITNYGGATGYPSYGYFGGGAWPYKSTVNRLDYSNDTAAAAEKGPLSAAGTYQSATGNKDYGYWGGGSAPSAATTVDRLDYANDTLAASERGPLNTARYRHGATGNTTQGYFIGGQPGTITTIERIDYSNDTPTATFVAPIIRNSGNSLRGAFSSQANALPQTLSQGTVGSYGAGYWAGGYDPASSPGPSALGAHSTVDRVDYANDTATALAKGPLSYIIAVAAATGNKDFGYVGGGGYPSPAQVTKVERINYSNDTPITSTRGHLTVARFGMGATGNVNFGYWAGGDATTTPKTTVDRLDYGSDTVDTVAKSPLSLARAFLTAAGNNNYGYFAGGYASPTSRTTVDRIDYSNDTPTMVEKGPLAAAAIYFGGTGNSDVGYFGGGGPSTKSSRVQRVNYANDTATALEKGPLTTGVDRVKATGNSSYGYWGGGRDTPSPSSKVSLTQRVDYSNDTSIAVTKGPLSRVTFWTASTSSRDEGLPIVGSTFSGILNTVTRQNYPSSQRGYWTGGFTPSGTLATIDRVVFANDTSMAVVKGSLGTAVQRNVSVSNKDFGYTAGGEDATGVTISKVQRLDYSNDGSTAAPKGSLSRTIRRTKGSVGNNDYGYFGGGKPFSPATIVSTVDRIDYSNDTPTAVVKGPLSAARYQSAGVGNQNFGYFAGGDADPGPKSEVYRIDYSNDTATTTTRGTLIGSREKFDGAGNNDYGYLGGGNPGAVTTIQRIDYANDMATAVAKGPLTVGRKEHGATGNKHFGYYAGGGNSGSTVDRLDYSTDTTAAVAKGPLTKERNYVSSHSGGQYALPQSG